MSRGYGGDRKIHWLALLAGEKAYAQTGKWLPQETLEQIKRYRVAIKGPLTTPVGGGIRSINVALRQKLDLYACIRPAKYIPGIPSPLLRPQEVDIVVYQVPAEGLRFIFSILVVQ